MHGSIKQMVCPDVECKSVVDMDGGLMAKLRDRQDVPCRTCNRHSLRCRIMLYDDKDGEQLCNTQAAASVVRLQARPERALPWRPP